MKHLCVIQLINSSVRSCGRSLQVPVIFQCRKGKNQSTVSELFYHTFATDYIIQGEAISLPPRWSTACSDEWYFVGHGMERSDLGSPFGRAGCPVRGSLRGSHVPIYAFNHQTEYPLSQPVRLTALPKGEPRALPRQCDKLQFYCLLRNRRCTKKNSCPTPGRNSFFAFNL